MKAGLLQIIPPGHTGKLQDHRHTSYAGLAFILLLCGMLLMSISWNAQAAVPAVNPQSGSVGLTGAVKGPPPTTAPVILSPRSGDHTTSIPITVSGLCVAGTFVTITKNDVFAGITTCRDNGTFSLQIDLFDGANRLIAFATDGLGQTGPNSAPVDVFYDAPSFTVPGGGTIGRQLFLQTTTTVLGTSPDAKLARTVTIVGGVGPYAVSWDWGDGQTSLVSQALEGPTSSSHAYDRPGNYRIIIHASDAAGNAAYLELVNVVNGPADKSTTGAGITPGNLLMVWPLLIFAGIMVGVFWLGEVREEAKLRRKGLLLR